MNPVAKFSNKSSDLFRCHRERCEAIPSLRGRTGLPAPGSLSLPAGCAASTPVFSCTSSRASAGRRVVGLPGQRKQRARMRSAIRSGAVPGPDYYYFGRVKQLFFPGDYSRPCEAIVKKLTISIDDRPEKSESGGQQRKPGEAVSEYCAWWT